MLKITVLAVGHIKEAYLRDACAEYEKRLGRYCRLFIVEVPDERSAEQDSAAQQDAVLRKEGDRLLRKLPDHARILVLDMRGEMISSEELAEEIAGDAVGGESHLVFVIGGSRGLSDDVKKRADRMLSFSRLTFPHQLMRVILLEQIYRGFRILEGSPYHK